MDDLTRERFTFIYPGREGTSPPVIPVGLEWTNEEKLDYLLACMQRIMPLVDQAERMLQQTPLQRLRSGLKRANDQHPG